MLDMSSQTENKNIFVGNDQINTLYSINAIRAAQEAKSNAVVDACIDLYTEKLYLEANIREKVSIPPTRKLKD
jgi:hypothetical protein